MMSVQLTKNYFVIKIIFTSSYISAPAKKKTENGGNKNLKRQLKKKLKSSEDSDTDEMFTTKQNVSAIVSIYDYLFNIFSIVFNEIFSFIIDLFFCRERKRKKWILKMK